MELLEDIVASKADFQIQGRQGVLPRIVFFSVLSGFLRYFRSQFSCFFRHMFFVRKILIFWKSLFYLSGSIIFEGQVPIWRLSGSVKIS